MTSQLTLGLAIALLAMPALATSQTNEERASIAFEQAEQAFVRKDYLAAGAAFDEAAALAPHASVYLNAAEAWELADNPVRAVMACDQARARGPLNATQTAALDAILGRTRPRVARLRIEGDPTARVRIGNGEPELLPIERVFAPAVVELRIVWSNGAEGARHVTLAAGEERVEVIRDPSPTERPSPPPASGVSVPTATWVFFGIGAGAGALVGVLGGLTLDAQTTFNEEPTWAHADTFYAFRASTNVAIGLTGAALLTGAIIWVVDAAVAKRASREKTETSAPWATVATW